MPLFYLVAMHKKGFIRSIIKIIHGWCGKTTHSANKIGQQKFEKRGPSNIVVSLNTRLGILYQQ